MTRRADSTVSRRAAVCGVLTVTATLFAAGRGYDSPFPPPAVAAGCGDDSSLPSPAVEDFAIRYPNKAAIAPADQGSTHEITYNPHGGTTLWVTGAQYDAVVEVGLNGSQVLHRLPDGSGPHGIEFDAAGRLYVSLEHAGQVARLDPATGTVLELHDVHADPHGLGIAPDGVTAWFTGKTANTVGKLETDGTVTNYPLPTADALPIYIKAGTDGNMWFTELTGNKIGRVTPSGVISEFRIPTANSRPIAIVPEPTGGAMWFTEEAGNNVARIDSDGTITEFAVPKTQPNVILGGLAFDRDGNLWVQQYVDQNHPDPPGADHIIKIDRAILTLNPANAASLTTTFYEVPTRKTVMHRIVEGPDGNMWFTELKADKVGRVFTGRSKCP